MSNKAFTFKQFIIEHDRCSMKIGSDAVLMGALLPVKSDCKLALEIGTGSGVISLMIAQRQTDLKIDAIEIDTASYEQATENFSKSTFSDRINARNIDLIALEETQKYDCIFSNPPYFYHSLKNDNQQKSIARHIDWQDFKLWLDKINQITHDKSELSFITPLDAFDRINMNLTDLGFNLSFDCSIRSFEHSEVIRKLCSWTKSNTEIVKTEFVIYQSEKVHSDQYIQALKDYLIVF